MDNLGVWPAQLEELPLTEKEQTEQEASASRGLNGQTGEPWSLHQPRSQKEAAGPGDLQRRGAGPEACVGHCGKQYETEREKWIQRGRQCITFDPLQASLTTEPGPQPRLAAHRPTSQVG